MKQWQKILLGAVVLYVLYRMFLVREGFDKDTAMTIGLIIGGVIVLAIVIYYIGAVGGGSLLDLMN